MTALGIDEVLDELESRAGASDTDRDAWLAERHHGATATEVRDLYVGAKSSSKLIAMKLGWEPEPDLSRIARIRYGRERERVIAEHLRLSGFLPETRVFRHAENSRYLASPDAIRLDFDDTLDVAEIKTAEEEMAPGSELFEKLGYGAQAQWQMFVVGPRVRRCLFAVEECLLEDGRYLPGELRMSWIERDDALIEELVAVADDFLATLDDVRENGLDPVAVALLEDSIEKKAAAEAARERLESYCATSGISSLRIPAGSLSYKVAAPTPRFQQKEFAADHPELAEKYKRATGGGTPTLRITPRRATKEEED
ncbi:MAG TPA: YqaJ viral recombinase family protein [Naasia sp.]